MTKIKWFLMSKYKRLLYNIECAHDNKQRLHLKNGIILDFTKDKATLRDYEEIRAKLRFLTTYKRADSDGRLILILDKKHEICDMISENLRINKYENKMEL